MFHNVERTSIFLAKDAGTTKDNVLAGCDSELESIFIA